MTTRGGQQQQILNQYVHALGQGVSPTESLTTHLDTTGTMTTSSNSAMSLEQNPNMLLDDQLQANPFRGSLGEHMQAAQAQAVRAQQRAEAEAQVRVQLQAQIEMEAQAQMDIQARMEAQVQLEAQAQMEAQAQLEAHARATALAQAHAPEHVIGGARTQSETVGRTPTAGGLAMSELSQSSASLSSAENIENPKPSSTAEQLLKTPRLGTTLMSSDQNVLQNLKLLEPSTNVSGLQPSMIPSNNAYSNAGILTSGDVPSHPETSPGLRQTLSHRQIAPAGADTMVQQLGATMGFGAKNNVPNLNGQRAEVNFANMTDVSDATAAMSDRMRMPLPQTMSSGILPAPIPPQARHLSSVHQPNALVGPNIMRLPLGMNPVSPREKMDTKTRKKQDLSRERNREHSRKSRKKKKEYFEELKVKVRELERFKLLVEQCYEMITLVSADDQATIQHASLAYARTLGIQPEDIVGKKFTELVVDEDEDQVREGIKRTLSFGEVSEIRCRMRNVDGSVVESATSARSSAEGIVLITRLLKQAGSGGRAEIVKSSQSDP